MGWKDYMKNSKGLPEEKDPYRIEKRKRKRDESKKGYVKLAYDKERDCYIWDEWTDVRMADIPDDAVHITGKKGKYLQTDIWPELTWPKEGQSAIHMYLWMISNKINADAITGKKNNSADWDWKKILMYSGLAILAIIIASRFL